MSTVVLPAAPARVGVRPGWWTALAADADPHLLHRLPTSSLGSGQGTRKALCGERRARWAEPEHPDRPGLRICPTCVRAASRCPLPDDVGATPAVPPPSRPRPLSGTTGEQDNAVAARVARRAAFRAHFDLSDRAQHYQPDPYAQVLPT